MSPIRHHLVGETRSPKRALGVLAAAVVCWGVTFAAYALGVFTISGGVVFVPGHGVLVGMVAAGLTGYARAGLVPAWLLAFASLLGYRADHAFLGLTHRSLSYRFGYFLQLEGLVVLALMGLVFAVIAFVVGSMARWGVDVLRGDPGSLVEG